jgi:hypothetical protein
MCLAAGSVHAIQLMLSKFEYDGKLNPNFREGLFELVLSSIEAYCDSTYPRFVYISSAGVTRPGRPGIKLEEEPPAVRMNDMLGGILTYKLKGEDSIRVGEPWSGPALPLAWSCLALFMTRGSH